jgi:hypothetical protein
MIASNSLLGAKNAADFIKNYAFFAYDLTNLTGADGAAISNGNAGLNDLSKSNRDAVIVGTPTIEELTYNGQTVKTLNDVSTNAISTGTNGTGIFNRQRFAIHLVFYVTDGQPAATHGLFGGIVPTNIGINIFMGALGNLGVVYGNSTGVTQWNVDVTKYLLNGVNGLLYLRVEFDFIINDVQIHMNGESMIATQSSPTMSGINPTIWGNTSNIYIGALNNNGTTTTNASSNSVLFAAVTPATSSFVEGFLLYQYIYDRFFKWQQEIHITSESSANTLRATLIASVFNGGGLPTISPTVTTGVSGNAHICALANITNKTSVDKLSFATTDVDGFTWTSVAYRIYTSATPNGNLIINCQGHISDTPSAHESFMSQALALGFDVLFVAPAISSNDNTETNPTVTSQSSTGHNQMLTGGLDRVGYNPVGLFFFDKISAVNHLAGDYTDIYFCGISGGGWSAVYMGAMDTRITKAVSVRGYMPRSFKPTEFTVDFEQGVSMITSVNCGPRQFANHSAISFIDMCLMATTDGRTFHGYTNRWDDCCFAGVTFYYWREQIQAQAATWGGEFWHEVDLDTGNAVHKYHQDDMDYILGVFN